LGDGLVAEIEHLGLAGRVRLIGFVDDADLPGLYSLADLFVFPSLYEGFGLPLLEAMACGAPVISSDASSLPEVVHGGEASSESGAEGGGALLLSPHEEAAWSEAMLRLLAEPAARARLVEAGFARAARFSWQSAARQLAELYGQLLETNRS
jgi:glycosyltransferase involved in cell wall biosynthesis